MADKTSLFQIADSQQGYFTASQAETCGYSRSNFHRYILAKEWVKEIRGIYRLALYPQTAHPDRVLWSLWSRNRKGEIQGVWSRETALEIYELSDVMSAKMHMSVPVGFRKSTEIPKHLVIHPEAINKIDVISQEGYLVTTPMKTLHDIVVERELSEDLIVQALQDALQKGLVSRKELHNNPYLARALDEYKL